MVTNEEIIPDGKDTTPEDIEFTEKVEVEVDGKPVEVGIEEDGTPNVPIPDDFDAEQTKEFLLKAKDALKRRTDEAKQTLIKAKTTRTEQNKLQAELEAERLKLQQEHEDLKAERLKLQQDMEAQKLQFSAKHSKDTLKSKMRELLKVNSDDEVADILQDEPKRWLEANETAQAFVLEQKLNSFSSTAQKRIENDIKERTLTGLVDSETYDPSDVLKYAKYKKLMHLSPTEIYNYYKTDHPKHNITDKINHQEQIKLDAIRPLKTSK